MIMVLSTYVRTSYSTQGRHQGFNPTKAKIQKFNRSKKLLLINVAYKAYVSVYFTQALKKSFHVLDILTQRYIIHFWWKPQINIFFFKSDKLFGPFLIVYYSLKNQPRQLPWLPWWWWRPWYLLNLYFKRIFNWRKCRRKWIYYFKKMLLRDEKKNLSCVLHIINYPNFSKKKLLKITNLWVYFLLLTFLKKTSNHTIFWSLNLEHTLIYQSYIFMKKCSLTLD